MKKVIVTGGLGFIGSNLISLLLKKKYSVINVDKVTYSANFYNVREFKNATNYKFIKADINNKKKLNQIFNKYKPKTIFNLAAETHVDRSIDGPENFIKSNILGVFSLLEVFKKFSKNNKNSKLIHISTDEVYGDVLSGRTNENHAYQPSSPYAATKAASDHLVSSYIRTYNLPAIISNCCNNYGPGQYPEKLIPLTIKNLNRGRKTCLHDGGEPYRCWLHADDTAEAVIKIIESGKLNEIYKTYCRHKSTKIMGNLWYKQPMSRTRTAILLDALQYHILY